MSTSGPGELHQQTGGYCRTHNMRLTFKVSPRPGQKLVQAAKVRQSLVLGDQQEERRKVYEVRRSSEEERLGEVLSDRKNTRVEEAFHQGGGLPLLASKASEHQQNLWSFLLLVFFVLGLLAKD